MGDLIGRWSLDHSTPSDRIQLDFNFCKSNFDRPITSFDRPTSIWSVVLDFCVTPQKIKEHIMGITLRGSGSYEICLVLD